MNENLLYEVTGFAAPEISLCDTAHIRPPYIHFRRKAPEYILYYIHSGELAIREDDREYLLTEGHFILLDPSCEHEGLRSTTCNFTYIHFSMAGIRMTVSATDPFETTARETAFSGNSASAPFFFPKCGHLDAEDLAEDFNAALSRLLSCVEDPPLQSYLRGSLLCELLALLAMQYRRQKLHAIVTASGATSYVPALKRYLSIHYATDISSGALEEMFHCNFDHLNRVFKKATGDTIFATLNRIRIENAKKYLATGLYTCSEVAVKCGFHDVYYFSRVFKKMTETTPAKYREKFL